ncbi:MAG: isopentenyl-diphosphate Delta-isomerase [Pseudomonadota bacterium]
MTQLIPAWVDGVLTPVEKLETHQRGLRHPAVSVFVMSDDQVLLQQRALSKYHTPGLWANACCTHPHWGEDFATCANRRLTEELGIVDLPLTQRDTIEYRADVGSGMIEHEVVTLFTGHGKPAMQPNPQEVAATRWVDLDTLRLEILHTPDRFTPWLRIYVTDHADQIFGEPV